MRFFAICVSVLVVQEFRKYGEGISDSVVAAPAFLAYGRTGLWSADIALWRQGIKGFLSRRY